MEILLIAVAAIGIVYSLATLSDNKKQQKKEKALEERRRQREQDNAERSVKYFEECRRKAVEEISVSEDTRIKPVQLPTAKEESTLSEPQEDSYIDQRITTDPEERAIIKGKLENFKNESESQNETILNLNKGDVLQLEEYGNKKIKVKTQTNFSLGFVDQENAEIFRLMNILDIKCTVRRKMRGKYGDAYLYLQYDVNKMEHDKASLKVEMKTSPMPKEYYELVGNRLPLGKRRWTSTRHGNASYFNRALFSHLDLEDIAKTIISKHISSKRFKLLNDESQLVSDDHYGYEICKLKGLNYRSSYAQDVAWNLKYGDIVAVVPDCYNEHHDSAHAVFTLSGQLIGYIDKASAESLEWNALEILECSVFDMTEHISLVVNYLKKYSRLFHLTLVMRMIPLPGLNRNQAMHRLLWVNML